MTPAEEVQSLLRFLTKDARIPLAQAMGMIPELRKNNLNSADLIAKTPLPDVQKHFTDEKLARQVFVAAKRVTKREALGLNSTPAAKRTRTSPGPANPADDAKALEESLKLPTSDASEAELKATVIQSNRAPLVLAIAVILLKYTMPEQPLSSRLSLGQGNVSMNSKSKAQAIGIDTSISAEQDGWGQGQPKVKVLGRDIPIMRRSGYLQSITENKEDESEPNKKAKTEEIHGSEDDLGSQSHANASSDSSEEAVWGLDLEALRKSNGPLIPSAKPSGLNGLPIFSPHSARSYLMKAFTIVEPPKDQPTIDSSSPSTQGTLKAESQPSSSPSAKRPKKTPAQIAADQEHALALVLQAIELLIQSWASNLSKAELDKRAWSWYMSVRPDVASGDKGWGQRGEIRLAKILSLRRQGIMFPKKLSRKEMD